jgi:hypothetical protein
LIVVASATVAAGALAMSSLPAFLPVTAAQTAIGVADAVFPPAVTAISLGIVGPAAAAPWEPIRSAASRI